MAQVSSLARRKLNLRVRDFKRFAQNLCLRRRKYCSLGQTIFWSDQEFAPAQTESGGNSGTNAWSDRLVAQTKRLMVAQGSPPMTYAPPAVPVNCAVMIGCEISPNGPPPFLDIFVGCARTCKCVGEFRELFHVGIEPWLLGCRAIIIIIMV
jgi:hypothetical protein